ncbi:family 16 glycoside hydrolase [Phycicoccus flavus]|uniref:family 16 glycoside hydrolase n=1 Tax=Phycicoccus flavus TaxID=2502783 RepID=UPI00197C2ECB|nr:family 16 glycoside hydrolase [Phycicoccus flavus]
MTRRTRQRSFRRSTGVLLASALAGLGALVVPPGALAAEAATQPGATLRVYDLGSARLTELCTLKSGQTPNVDKYVPVIDYSTEAEFGLSDNFISHTVADLVVPTDGEYSFRLTSDDGSRLTIDDTLVVDHDGLRGIDPPGLGSTTLTAGSHPLLLEHFEAGGGQQVTLEWRVPGSDTYVLVPTDALATPADVVRVTAPGSKACEGDTDSPGDGIPLESVNPIYDLVDLRPGDFEPMVSAMAWDDQDRLLVATSGNVSPGGPVDDPESGEVFRLEGVLEADGPEDVTVTKIAGDLLNPMGMTVVEGTVYVSERNGLTALRPDTDGDGLLEQDTIAEWPYGGTFHEFAFGLIHRDGAFWVNLSVAIDAGGATTNPQPAENRGTAIRVDDETGEVTYVASGLRTPNGMGIGPDGEMFISDNQGGWLPGSKIMHLEQGRFFNHRTNPAGPFDDEPVTRPVVWLPQNEIGNSPSNPVLLQDGPFAGQFVIGDVTYGGLQRAFVETVDDQYQGAVFRHTAGLEAGVNRTLLGPDGSLFVGGIGEAGNWSENGKLKYGLQKLEPNGATAFEMHEMRATATGFDVEYTEPLSAETAAGLADAYQLQQWTYSPATTYGGPKIGEETLAVSGATLSEDGRTVSLEVEGLKKNRVVHLRSPRSFTSAEGEELWTTEAWYTLNERPGDDEQPTFLEAEEGQLDGGATIATDHPAYSADGFVAGFDERHAGTTFRVEADAAGSADLGLRYANGPDPFRGDKTLSLVVNGERRQVTFPSTGTWDTWSTLLERVELEPGTNTVEVEVGPNDTGHVNLDAMSVRPAGERIELLGADGDLSEWQHPDGRSPEWPAAGEGVVEVCCGDLRTKESFGDYRLHVEFWLPEYPADVTGQERANSGVYQQDRYEVQVLDSYGVEPLATNDAAAIYQQKAADTNAATPAGTWQSYDVDFTAARFDADGTKVSDARITMDWNGERVHDDVAITGPTGGGAAETPAAGPIRLQDHGNPVRYRNIWVEREYNEVPTLTASAEPTSGNVPLDVAFTASATDPEGTDVSYAWDFGDGTATATGAEAAHTYETPGTFTARVTATDADGRSTSRTFRIRVGQDCADDVEASDEFEGTFLDRCRWTEIVREDADHYRVTGGHLEIDALDGDMHGGATNARNLVLQDAPDGAWEASAFVTLPEGEQYEQAGIIVHESDRDFVKLMMMDDPGQGWVAELGQTIGGQAVFDASLDRVTLPAGSNTSGIWLKVTFDGAGYTAAWSADGEQWTALGRTRPGSSMPDPQVGLAAYNGNGQAATFDSFRVGAADVTTCETPFTRDEGFRMLFDGTAASLAEWRMAGPGGFALQEDCSILSQGGLGLLYHPEELESYRLTLDWKLAGDDNGGVFVGFPDPGTDPWLAVDRGREIQIDATDDADSTTGAVYNAQAADVEARDAALNPPGEWNTYEIVKTGPRIRVLLNGSEINDFTETDPARLNTPSLVGIQNHGNGDEVYYRDIQVQDLETPDGPAPTLELTAPEQDAVLDDGDVRVAGTTDAVEVDVRVGTRRWTTTPQDGAFEVDVALANGSHEVVVYAYAEDGSSTVERRTVVVRDFGELVGSLTDPAGDDDGPGTYVYPANEVFEDGVFDLTGLEVYRDGEDLRFVTSIDGPVTNPSAWGGDQVSMQRVNVYVGDGSGEAAAALPGTNMDTASAWSAAVVIDGRFGLAGVYAPDGTKLADGEMFSVPSEHRFGVTVPASAFGDLDPERARYGTAMFVNAEGGEGIGNVRPVYDLEYWQNPPAGLGFVRDWRLGGGAGEWDDSPAHDTDLRDPNALDVLVGPGQQQATVMDWTASSPVRLPMVALDGTQEPLTLEVSLDPSAPDGEAGWYVSPVTVSATTVEDATVDVDVDGSGWTAMPAGGLVVDEDGEHEIRVRAVRGEESTEVETVTVKLDATAPVVTVDGLEDGASVGTSEVLDLGLLVEDATSGVDSVAVTLDGRAVGTGAAEQSLPLDASTLAVGEHVMRVRASDVAGSTTTLTLTFTVTASVADATALLQRFAADGDVDAKTERTLARQLGKAQDWLDRDRDGQAVRELQKARQTVLGIQDATARAALLRTLDAVLGDLR